MCTTMSPLLLCTAHIVVSRAIWQIHTQEHIRIVTHFVRRFVAHCSYRFGPVIQFPDLQPYHQQSQSPLSCPTFLPPADVSNFSFLVYRDRDRDQNTSCVPTIRLTSCTPSTNTAFVAKDGVSHYARQLRQTFFASFNF